MIYVWSDDLRCLEKLINNLTALQSRIASWETWCSHQQDLTRGGDIMTISILYSFCGLLAFLAISVLTEDELHCPDDYVAVTRYGRQQCNQAVWRDLQLTGFRADFPLPMVRSEGWHQDSWTMCMHGTLGPTETTFLLKLWRPDDDVAKVKAIYWQNNSTVVMEEWEGEQRVGEETMAPKPYPFATGQEFSITIHISNDTVTYNLCGSECFTMDRSLPDSDIHTLRLFMQASVDYLDLWCM